MRSHAVVCRAGPSRGVRHPSFLLKEIEGHVVWETNPQITTIERENIDIRRLASRAIYRTGAEALAMGMDSRDLDLPLLFVEL
jgi:hypothetical protein